MSERTPLDRNDIEQALRELAGWSYEEGTLRRSYEFGDFREAVSFIVRISFVAEEMNHHPEITNVYNAVELSLSTHDAGNAVTRTDLELARRIGHISWV